MIAFFGKFLLWASLLFSIIQLLISQKGNNILNIKFMKIVTGSVLIAALMSFFLLISAHVNSDFTISNVFLNSHTSKPLIYKISGVWGNHEGSMILWIVILAIFNYLIFKILNQKNFDFIFKTLETQALILIGFIIFTIFTSNPFQEVIVEQENGLGFNPILQDPFLAIHPPLLYIGYVGLSAAFSFSIAALSVDKKAKINWHLYMKPFVLLAWSFLTIGIALGSIWAYYELGWGGWWFWDPVENASFMPWLIATALLHSLIVVKKKQSLKKWVLLLSILAFILSILGTFLVRSGILTSVHAFALDPSRGIYILGLVGLLGGYALILFALKSNRYKNENYFSFFTKEGAILVNNIIMIVVCFTVFLGTVYPLLIEALTNNKISVGEPYYNSTVVPIMLPAIIVMGFTNILTWGKEKKIEIIKKSYLKILLIVTATIIIFLIYKSYSFIGVAGIVLAFWIILNNTENLIQKILIKYNNRKFLNNINFYNSVGMIIAHLGFGFLILGITGSSIWQKEKILQMQVNDKIVFNKNDITFKSINEIKGPNYLAIEGTFLITDNKNRLIAKLKPEKRYYPITNNFTSEVSIHTNLLRDLYMVLGEGNTNTGWVVKIYYNPLVIWIWIGSLTIFFGGIVSFSTNAKKINT